MKKMVFALCVMMSMAAMSFSAQAAEAKQAKM